jgi:hypothetical protein
MGISDVNRQEQEVGGSDQHEVDLSNVTESIRELACRSINTLDDIQLYTSQLEVTLAQMNLVLQYVARSLKETQENLEWMVKQQGDLRR